MFLSGVVKLSSGDPTWRDLTALSYHYETTCLPTWTGWYMHALPLGFHKASAAMMFAIELLLPFAAFGPRRLRLVSAAAFVGLMVFIAATGNYGFFNLLAIVLCLPLFDDSILRHAMKRRGRERQPDGTFAGNGSASALDYAGAAVTAADRAATWPRLVTLPVASVVLLLTPMPLVRAMRLHVGLPDALVQLYELQEPFHLVNGYGLFATMTTERPEIVVEGSDDGDTWRTYEFRWKPGDPLRRPEFVQPHMPRLDWQMWFAALGSPRSSRWFLAFCERLLEGAPPVLALLRTNPFPTAPPRYLRATLYDYHFTTPTSAARRERGGRAGRSDHTSRRSCSPRTDAVCAPHPPRPSAAARPDAGTGETAIAKAQRRDGGATPPGQLYSSSVLRRFASRTPASAMRAFATARASFA